MRGSLFRRSPVRIARVNQRFVPSAAAVGTYTLTVTTLAIPVTLNNVTFSLTGSYSLAISSLSVPIVYNNVNLIWVGAPIVLAKSNKIALSMRMGL